MKIKFLIAALILNFCFSFGQKIEILNIEKNVESELRHYILYCELVNNSNEKIILPLPTEFSNEINPNSYNYFYRIKVSPKNSIDVWQVPPYQMQEVKKLNIHDFVIAEPKERVRFKINTKDLVFYNKRFNKDIPPKEIRLIYQPFNADKERNLSPDLQELKIHPKKIISKKYKL